MQLRSRFAAVAVGAILLTPAAQADQLADFGDGQRCVFLHDGEDLPVDGIHSSVPPENRINYYATYNT